MSEERKAASVVDYDAWNRGYMPPTEHILIHKLSHEGARVVLSSWLGGDSQIWVVMEGAKPLTTKQRRLLLRMLEMWFEDQQSDEAEPDERSFFEIVSDGPNRWVVTDERSDERECPVFTTRDEAEAYITRIVGDAAPLPTPTGSKT